MIHLGRDDVAAIRVAYLDDEGWTPASEGPPSFALSHERPIVRWWNEQVEFRDVRVASDHDSVTRAIPMKGVVNRSPIAGVVPAGSVLLGAVELTGAESWIVMRIRKPPILWNEMRVDEFIVPCEFYGEFDHEEES